MVLQLCSVIIVRCLFSIVPLAKILREEVFRIFKLSIDCVLLSLGLFPFSVYEEGRRVKLEDQGPISNFVVGMTSINCVPVRFNR